MFKLTALTTLTALAIAGGLSTGFAAESSADVQVRGTNIATDIRLIGKNAHLKYVAAGKGQRNHVLVGSCPEGTEAKQVVFRKSGLNLAIPYCE